jgi:CDP-glucose 4,6-dehydratase
MNCDFWKNRSVFVTGHTGFKGGWICLWLSLMGAKVYGYSLQPLTNPNFFTEVLLKKKIKKSFIGNLCNLNYLIKSMKESKPSVVIHMAAQPLVFNSYDKPIETFNTNIIGTANLLEASRKIKTIKAIINVTSDKCYENLENSKPFNENDKLGGQDPYSGSKACSEIIANVYQKSFLLNQGIHLASVRAGNVIGGGDWSQNRLIPDFFRSLESKKILLIRSPYSTRPWQHVLEPLRGYLSLAEKLVLKGTKFSGPWNFGPSEINEKSVLWVIKKLSKKFSNVNWKFDSSKKKYEAKILKLNSLKAQKKLNWKPKLSTNLALDLTSEWHEAYIGNKLMDKFSIEQIQSYQKI